MSKAKLVFLKFPRTLVPRVVFQLLARIRAVCVIDVGGRVLCARLLANRPLHRVVNHKSVDRARIDTLMPMFDANKPLVNRFHDVNNRQVGLSSGATVAARFPV